MSTFVTKMEKQERFEQASDTLQVKEVKINYSNDEITVVWKPKLCIHSGRCFNGLPEVFNPWVRHWVNVNRAPAESIISQVKQCPSGALSYLVPDKHNTKEV